MTAQPPHWTPQQPPAAPGPQGWPTNPPHHGAPQPLPPTGPRPAGMPGPVPTGGQMPPSQPARPGQPAQPQQRPVEAPAPTPPDRVEHGLPVVTTEMIPGQRIVALVGDVLGVVVRPREPGGNAEIQARTLLGERQLAISRMASMARRAGGDAVIGLRFDTCPVSAHLVEVVAYGTAVRLAAR